MISDTYFSACIGHDVETRDAVLSLLRTLGVCAPDARSMSIALKELERCDIWTQVYSIPALLRALSTRELDDADSTKVTALLTAMVTAGTGTQSMAKLLDLVIQNGRAEDVASALEDCADDVLSSDPLPVSATPYMDLPTQAFAVIWTALLRHAILRRERQAVVNLLQGTSSTRAVVDAALANRFGRLPLRLVVEALDRGGQPVADDQLVVVCGRAGDADLEPDLVGLHQSRLIATIKDSASRVIRALREPGHPERLAPDPERSGRLLRTLGVPVPDDPRELAAKASELAEALRFSARFAAAIECQPGAVFEALADGLKKNPLPFWMLIRSGPRLKRYADDAVLASLRMEGPCIGLLDFLERDKGAPLHVAAWCFLTHAADVMLSAQRDRGQTAATLPILTRVCEARLPVEEVLQLLAALPSSNFTVRLKARVAVRLTGWFLLAYRRAVEWREEKRWLASLPDLSVFARGAFEDAKSLGIFTGDDLVNSACASVLLAKADLSGWDRLLPRVQKGKWPHSARELLLPIRLEEGDWYDNDEPQDPKKFDRAKFAPFIATGRCMHRDEGSTRIPTEEWDRVFSRLVIEELDSLLRVALIGLLRTPTLPPEQQNRIVELMLASDSPYELDETLKRVFGRDAAAGDELAEHAYDLLVARVESERQRAKHRDHPNQVAVELDRADALRVCVDWLACLMSRDQAGWHLRFDNRRAMARALQSPVYRMVTYVVEYINGKPVLRAEEPDMEGRPLHVAGAAFDNERQRATVLAAVLDPGDQLARGVLEPLPMQKRPRHAIGLVESIEREDDARIATVQLGPSGKVRLTLDESPMWVPGALVDVALDWQGANAPIAARGQPTVAIPLLLKEGDLEQVTVNVTDEAVSSPRFDVSIKAGLRWNSRSFLGRHIDKSAWMPQQDTTRLSPPNRWARVVDGKWRPAIEDRLSLLVAMNATHVEQVVLAWTGRMDITSVGEVGWVLDAGCGLLYAVGPTDLEPESLGRIRALLESGGEEATSEQLVEDALIVVARTVSGRLRCVETRRDRLEWKDQFRDDDLVQVQGDEGGDFVLCESVPPGRPVRIPVKWEGGRPHMPAQAVVLQWDPQACILRLKSAMAAMPNRDQWPRQCEAWSGLRRGDRVNVLFVRSTPGNHLAQGRTRERFDVDVHVEEWWGWSRPIKGPDPRERECVVTRLTTWKRVAELADLSVVSPDVNLAAPEWNETMGIVCVVPRTQGIWVAVVWVDRVPRVVSLSVELSRGVRPPRVGDRIVLRNGAGICRLTVERRQVIARPIWKICRETEGLPPDAQRIAVRFEGSTQIAVQGWFGALHLTERTQEWRSPSQEGRFRWSSGPFLANVGGANRSIQRLVAITKGGEFVTGYVAADAGSTRQPYASYRWTISDELEPVEGGLEDEVHLSRTFRAIQPAATTGPAVSAAELAEAQLQAKLDKLIADATPIDVQVEGAKLRLLGLTLPAVERTAGNSVVPLLEERATYVSSTQSQPGVALLVRRGGRLAGSTMRVPPSAAIREWIELLSNAKIVESTDPNTAIRIGESPLFYVGRELANPLDDMPYEGGPRYRFEWAPGRCLVVPGRCLRFASEPFASAAGQLFFGDAIRDVALITDEGGEWILDIRGVWMQSAAHMLFDQARRWNVVHLLHVQRAEEVGIAVATVEGVDEASRESRVRVVRTHASITEVGRARLTEALGERMSGFVHGRLDQEGYLGSSGQQLSFEPVWLKLGADGLRERERIFLTAGEIALGANDCFLQFCPPEDLIGPWPNLRGMGRRRFSARADLLRRIAAEDRGALAGMKYLVRVRERDGSLQPEIFDPDADARGQVPFRLETQLREWLKSTQDPPLVTVLQDDVDGQTLLEVRPGVFIALPSDHLQCETSRPLSFGTVLRLRLSRDRPGIYAVAAMPSDEELVPPGGRGVTLLPMKPRDGQSAQPRPLDVVRFVKYTAEGLPNAVAALARQEEQLAVEMVDLLREHHPRPAWIAMDGQARVSPRLAADTPVFLTPAIAVGALQFWRGPSRNVPWPELTFTDSSGVDVSRRAREREWRAHDSETWRFVGRGGVEAERVETHAGDRSLLFAQSTQDGPRLRYSPEELRRFVFPPRELAAMLPSDAQHCWRLSIAAIDHERRWLFVEVTPGRIYVLPLTLLVTQAAEGLNEAALVDLALECFGQGDEVDVCRATSGTEEVDRIRLVNFIPGARSALGGEALALRLVQSDGARGASEFGAESFTLTLPGMADPNQQGNLWIISPDNNRTPPHGALVGAGALLRAQSNRLGIDGLPDYQCLPDRNYGWNDDPIGASLFVPPERPAAPPLPGPVLLAAGGAVPITIEHVDDGRRVVYFSRRRLHQPDIVGVCPLRVFGISAEGTCLVRLGNQLRACGMRDLVWGLSADFEAAKQLGIALARALDLLWGYMDEAGGVRCGLAEPRKVGDTGSYSPICAVFTKQSVLGLVCQCTRSRGLHWLPLTELAWADLSKERTAVQALLMEGRRPLRAVVQKDGSLSVIRHPLAHAEFTAALPGSQLVVHHTGVQLADGTTLVRSAVSGVLLSFAATGPHQAVEEKAVVRRRDTHRRTLYAEDLANSMLLDVGIGDDVDVAAEIAAILEAHGSPARQAEARGRFHELVRRAWRHWAAEVVQRTAAPARVSLWARYAELRSVMLGQSVVTGRFRSELNSFCRSVELSQWRIRGDKSLLHVSAACRAIAGDIGFLSVDAMRAASTARCLSELADLAPPKTFVRVLPEQVIGGLRAIHADLLRDTVKVRFGPPLPQLL